MDLVEGLKEKGEPFLLVLTERQTRQEIIEKIPNKKAESVVKGLDCIERRFGVANGFIRRFLPKGTSFKGINRTLVKKIQKFINT